MSIAVGTGVRFEIEGHFFLSIIIIIFFALKEVIFMMDAQLLSLKKTQDRGYAAAIFLSGGKFRVVVQYIGLTKFIKMKDFEKRSDAEALQTQLLAEQERFANDPD